VSGQIVLPPSLTGIRQPYDSHRCQGGTVRKMRMFLVPLTVAAAIVAMVVTRRPGKLGGRRKSK
jgi:hypothetical protein